MKVTKLAIGLYKVVDTQGTWIARGPSRDEGDFWNAYDCDNEDDCSSNNNWGASFKTFAQLKKYAQSF